MKIAIVASPHYPSPPYNGYGGTQRGAYELSQGLAERGHEVSLVASGDSQVGDHGIQLVPNISRALCADGKPTESRFMAEMAESRARTIRVLGDMVAKAEVDVINLRWEDPTIIRSLAPLGTPLVVSIGCGIKPEETSALIVPDCHVAYTAHTEAHKISLGNHPRLKVAPYGVNMSQVKVGVKPLQESEEEPSLSLLRDLKAKGQDYFVHVGTILPRKGQHSAILIAQETGVPLVLAGMPSDFPSNDSLYSYFRDDVEPFVDKKSVYHFGNANEAQKYELMRFARALIFSSGLEDPTWSEPFGRILAESTASGTPVLGYRHGSFSELIKEGVTGIGFDTIKEAVEKASQIASIDRAMCATHARKDMSSERFVANMEELFESMIQRK